MNAITPFHFDSHPVRIVDRDGLPWFVAADVCTVLGLSNHRDTVSKLDDDERDAVGLTDAIGRQQNTTVVSESGLYTIILRCREAMTPGSVPHRFRKWVTGEVLPSIRRTGSYGAQPVDPMKVLNDPAAMRGLLLTYSEKVIALESANAALAPKAEALDHIAATDGSYAPTDAAKTLGVQPKQLFSYLRGEARWMYRRPGTSGDVAYQDKIQRGLMEHKVHTIYRTDGSEKAVTQARITAKGLTHLALALRQEVA